MEKYSAWDMAWVAIILRSLFTSGSSGSTARSRESAKALLVLQEQNQSSNKQSPALGRFWVQIWRWGRTHLVFMQNPPALAVSTSISKRSSRGGGWRLSSARQGKASWILRATQWLA